MVRFDGLHLGQRTLPRVEYLSDQWFQAAAAAVAELAVETDVDIVLEQRVTATDPHEGEDAAFQVVISAGRVSLDRACSRTRTVTLTQSRATADEIRSGRSSALSALQDGRIRIDGDPRGLLEAAGALALVDEVLAELGD